MQSVVDLHTAVAASRKSFCVTAICDSEIPAKIGG
jgi:hypothetical protein